MFLPQSIFGRTCSLGFGTCAAEKWQLSHAFVVQYARPLGVWSFYHAKSGNCHRCSSARHTLSRIWAVLLKTTRPNKTSKTLGFRRENEGGEAKEGETEKRRMRRRNSLFHFRQHARSGISNTRYRFFVAPRSFMRTHRRLQMLLFRTNSNENAREKQAHSNSDANGPETREP